MPGKLVMPVKQDKLDKQYHQDKQCKPDHPDKSDKPDKSDRSDQEKMTDNPFSHVYNYFTSNTIGRENPDTFDKSQSESQILFAF